MSVSSCPPSGPNRTLPIDIGHQMMDIISANDIARSSATNVDPVAVTQDLHGMVNLVALDQIVACVEKRANVVRLRMFWQVSEFMPSDGAIRFAFGSPRDKAGE